MRRMQNSGITWIGDIPEEWKVGKAKHYAIFTNGSDPRLEGDVPVYGSGASSFKTCGEYKDGPCVLVGRKGATLHIPHYIDHRYWNVDTAFDVKTKYNYNLKYYFYLATCFDYKLYISQTTLPGMTQTNYENMILPVPPQSEQAYIADFLDAECARIDAIIEQTRASIEEYKKLKQAVITQAVTKGIRPDRPMKDSEVEWIEEIPINWKECRIKDVIFPQQKPVFEDDEIITCFRDGIVTLRKHRREDGFTVSFTEKGYQGVDTGDLVIHGMDAFAGAIGCSDSRGKTTPVVHVCKTSGNNRYFMYFLRSMAYGDILMDLSNGVRIRSSDFRNFAKLGVFRIVVPPVEEQDEIVLYLDEKVSHIERLINQKELLLSELESYKKSLIFEYVTGKKEL